MSLFFFDPTKGQDGAATLILSALKSGELKPEQDLPPEFHVPDWFQ